jgi:hypothetical protein
VAPPILALAIAMVLAPFRTLLVTAVGQAVLLLARALPTEVAAVVLSPVTVATDPEDLTTTAGTTNSLTEDNFGVGRHPRPEVGLDNGDRSWQLETVDSWLPDEGLPHREPDRSNGRVPIPTGGDQAIR